MCEIISELKRGRILPISDPSLGPQPQFAACLFTWLLWHIVYASFLSRPIPKCSKDFVLNGGIAFTSFWFSGVSDDWLPYLNGGSKFYSCLINNFNLEVCWIAGEKYCVAWITFALIQNCICWMGKTSDFQVSNQHSPTDLGPILFTVHLECLFESLHENVWGFMGRISL